MIANILIYDVLAIFYYFIISCFIMWIHEKTKSHTLIIDILSIIIAVGLVISYISFYSEFFMENRLYLTALLSSFLFAELLEIEFNLPRLDQSKWSWKRELTFFGICYLVLLLIFVWAQNIFDVLLSFLLFLILMVIDYWVYYKSGKGKKK